MGGPLGAVVIVLLQASPVTAEAPPGDISPNVAFSVSNRYADMRGPLAAIASDLGLAGVVGYDPVDDPDLFKWASRWVLLARDAADLPAPDGAMWSRLDPSEVGRVWTDDFSDLASVVSWD